MASAIGVDKAFKSLVHAAEATKGERWMPRLAEAMKDVLGCEKPGGAAKKR